MKKIHFSLMLSALLISQALLPSDASAFNKQPFSGLKANAALIDFTADMDGDGIPDWLDDDIDGDGISNDYEVRLGFDPRDPNLTPPDLDGDGIPDAFDDDIDGDGVLNYLDAFPYDPTEWADTDGDGIGDNSDPDIDGDGFSNEEERKAGTDPYDKNSFPDYDAPVVDLLSWSTREEGVFMGMAYDDGMGVKSIRLQSATDSCEGQFSYGNNFTVYCPQAKQGSWQLIVEDRAGNRRTVSLND